MILSRPECGNGSGNALPDSIVLDRVYSAVRKRRGLVHGKLDSPDGHCAMGCFWEDNKGSVSAALVEQIATVNDSVPPIVGKRERRAHVLRWLEWKLGIAA